MYLIRPMQQINLMQFMQQLSEWKKISITLSIPHPKRGFPYLFWSNDTDDILEQFCHKIQELLSLSEYCGVSIYWMYISADMKQYYDFEHIKFLESVISAKIVNKIPFTKRIFFSHTVSHRLSAGGLPEL